MAERCPYQRIIRGGDESMEFCDLVDKWCLLMSDIECDEYNDFLKEVVQ